MFRVYYLGFALFDKSLSEGNFIMYDFWKSVSQAQASIISAAIALVTTISGVLLGWVLFSNKVNSLKSAVSESEKIVKEHLEEVGSLIKRHNTSINDQLSSFSLQIGQVRGAVADLPTASSPSEATPSQNANERIREGWSKIRDQLEEIASDPRIDGRVRAKYGRIDRRNYSDLIFALNADKRLNNDYEKYQKSITLWLKYRAGRSTPSDKEIAFMEEAAMSLGQHKI